MRTYSRIRAHQSTSETINTSLKEKNKASFCQLLRRCGSGDTVHFRDEFLSFLIVKQHGSKITFHDNVKENLCHFSINIPAFFRYIG